MSAFLVNRRGVIGLRAFGWQVDRRRPGAYLPFSVRLGIESTWGRVASLGRFGLLTIGRVPHYRGKGLT